MVEEAAEEIAARTKKKKTEIESQTLLDARVKDVMAGWIGGADSRVCRSKKEGVRGTEDRE